jgi:hypothetical protein
MYKNEWVSWPDWLGYGVDKPKRGSFLPFEVARELARKQHLSSGPQVRCWVARDSAFVHVCRQTALNHAPR